MNEDNKFYYQGQSFDSEDEFWAYVKRWPNLPLDEQTANRILETLKKEIKLNLFIKDIKFSNSQFSNYIEKVFTYAIRKLDDTDTSTK